MRDSQMFNILSTLDDVENNKKTTAPLTESINNDTAIKENPESTMRSFLEMMEPTDISRRLDESAARSEGPKLKQMPGTHTMAKSTAKRHPASKFLVGGEEGETPDDKDAKLDENESSMYKDLMRDLEELSDTYGENAQNEDWFNYLQDVIGNYGGNVYGEYNANDLDSDGNLPEAAEMGGSDARLRLGKEWDINLDEAEDTGWGDELIEDLKLLIADEYQRPEDIVSGVEDLISQYEAPAEPTYNDVANTEDGDYATMEDDGVNIPFDDKYGQNADGSADVSGFDDDDEFNSIGNSEEEVEETYDSARGQFVKQTSNPYKAMNEDDLEEESLSAKQSFADVFKSMDESEDEKSSRLEKELFTELDEPEELTKADNGKFNLKDGS